MEELLFDHERPAYTVRNGDGKSRIFLTCDHAFNAVPERLGDLGVSADTLNSHAGWDIGAYEVSTAISDALDAPLVATKFSRLVIDCNRPLDAPESIPPTIHGVTIPGNVTLTADARRRRYDELFFPYHEAITETLSSHIRRKGNMYYLAIHSFTPILNGRRRPWPIGITYENQSSFASYLIEELQNTELRPVGINQPYPVTRDGDYGMHAHGGQRNVDAVLIEIRQDLLREGESIKVITDHLLNILLKFEATGADAPRDEHEKK